MVWRAASSTVLAACLTAACTPSDVSDAGSLTPRADAGSDRRAIDGGGHADAPSDARARIDADASRDAGAGTGRYLLYEKFNEMPTGATPTGPWTTNGSVLVQEVPFATDKSVQIAKPATADAASNASLSTTFPAQNGRVVFEAKVLARETAGFKAIPYIYDSAGNTIASVSFQDGYIQAHVGGAISTVQAFVANQWYRVRVVVDTNASEFDLYVDGVRVGHAQQLRAAATAVNRVRYYLDGTGAGTLLVDNVKVYTEASFIGPPPAPVFDARKYGAKGDGVTNDAASIQAAIAAASGTGGSVLLADGTYLSGTLTLASKMTFFIDASATLRGSTNVADYPTQTPPTGNTQLANCQRALLYAPGLTHLALDGGGAIDGQGDSFSGVEATRPLLFWFVLSQNVTVQNVYLMKGAVWSLVSMESDHVRIDNVNLQSNGITHDGIDIVDGTDITVDECAISSGDDAMCPKSGVRRGIDGLTITNSIFSGNGTSGGSNGIKLGTATYGAFTHITAQDDYVKNVQYAAMAVESRQGSDISGVEFSRIELDNAGSAFFVYLAQQNTTHPTGDVPKLGSIDRVSFTDISGSTANWANSPHQGALITGNVFDGVMYRISNLAFTNVAVTFDGGLGAVPASPPEAIPNQYPESNMFGPLPAWGYYLRHVAGASFTSCTSQVAATDARPKMVTDDVTGLIGSP